MINLKKMEKKLGKIDLVKFGLVGYQGAMLGLSITFNSGSYGVSSEKCTWDCNMVKHTDNCKWTEEDRSRQFDEIMRFISDLLYNAKVDNIMKLSGKPVELTFEGNLLKDWRILTECI